MLRDSRNHEFTGSRRRMGAAIVPGLALIFALGGSAFAETPAGLAPPGACAEPREAVIGVAPPSISSSVGPLATFFSPSAVAAPATPAPRPRPAITPSTRPGPCDQPGAGCAVPSAPVPVTPPTVGPGVRP